MASGRTMLIDSSIRPFLAVLFYMVTENLEVSLM